MFKDLVMRILGNQNSHHYFLRVCYVPLVSLSMNDQCYVLLSHIRSYRAIFFGGQVISQHPCGSSWRETPMSECHSYDVIYFQQFTFAYGISLAHLQEFNS